MNKKGMINIAPSIVLYIGLIGVLILSHYLTFRFPLTVQIINKPWSLPEEIVIGIMIAPIMLLILLFPVAYIEEKHAESMAKKCTKNMELSILKITEPSTWSKVYHCHIKSDKIDTGCKIVCYKDSETIKSIIFPKEWRERNKEIYKYKYYIKATIKNKLQPSANNSGQGQ
ncbi:hypothetical protein [Thermoanaerobacterium butyriciformans]|uniref:Uncharacterized protein n=1 Tax=Thermoanaerobacterium butyriciformans TaxID=1702242 RepID=A0ABS4NAX5_9THEO|nr:hypothetical protein [Thermoanaerobacterium butyriciformans]MBP2070796.1 hypothetical protein [Thermoanaerobacterium butyriciformans]